MSDLPKRSIRITDLSRLDTAVKIDSKQELLFPVASNQEEKDTFSMPLNSFVEWLLLKHAANKDLSNLSDIGQAILDAKQDYFNLITDDTDFDTFVNDGIYKVNVTGTVEVHAPTDATGFYVVSVDTDNGGVIEQQAKNLYISSGNIYHRQRVNGTWTNWGLITQDMESPTFVDAPTVINPGTNDDQLATIGQLNGKFADIFKTEFHITEGVFVSGNINYSNGTLTVSNGSKYITNDSNTNILTSDTSTTIPTTGTHYAFINFAGEILYWDNFEKVAAFPSDMIEGVLYYDIMNDAYADSTTSYALTPLGTVKNGDFSQKSTIEFLNVENLQATLDALHVPLKVEQMIGDENQNSTVSSETQYERNMSASHYEGSEGEEYSLAFGAGVSVTSHSEEEPGEFVKDVTANIYAKDGENETSINLTPTSAILTNPRLDEPSEIATLADIEEIKQTSLTFIGYVSQNEPSSETFTFNRGNLWISGATMPTTLPVPAEDIKVWNGTQWVASENTYNPKDFDFFRNINDKEGYYWFGGAWKVMSTDMDTSYFVLGTDGKWKIKDDVNLPGAPTTSTPVVSDNSTKIATTAFVQSIASTKQNTLTPGTGIEITDDGTINNTQTSAEWGKITGTLSEQTDLAEAIANAGTPDGVSIDKTSEQKLRAIGLINKNSSATDKVVYDWVGTLAEWTSQNVATTHPEWTCYITDDITEVHEAAFSHNVGDIFYTLRKDDDLHGAVECNGRTYNIDNYAGPDSIGELLTAGKVPYVSLSQYDSLLTANGVVGVFGWDGGSNKNFKVPYLKDMFVEAGTTSELGNHVAPGLPNITGSMDLGQCGEVAGRFINSLNADGAIQPKRTSVATWSHSAYWGSGPSGISIDASRSSSIYGKSSTVQPKAIKLRAMVQLYNGTNDEAILTFNNRINELDSSVVHKTGNETIANSKTFTADPSIKKSTPLCQLMNTDVNKGEAVEGTKYSGIKIISNDSKELGYFRHAYYTSNNVNNSQMEIIAIDPTGGNNHTQLTLWNDGIPANRKVTVNQQPAATSNDGTLATTKWVNDKIGNINSILDTINGEVI